MSLSLPQDGGLREDALAAQFKRDGYVVVRRLLGPKLVAASLDALVDLASGRQPAGQAGILYEPGQDGAEIAAEARIDRVRKFIDFVEDFPALKRVAMLRNLHDVLDRLMGPERVLFQEMALVKPPRIGADKPWHQDASYFRIADPSLVVGTWIALDPALRNNGCMEVIPGSQLRGPVPHVHENDFNRCRIDDRYVDSRRAVQVEMQPGDALIFQSLLQHFTAANRSDLTRRAIQFHYHQIGTVWGSVADHQRLYHDAAGNYAGCTVPHEPTPPGFKHFYRDGLIRPIVPMDEVS